MNYIVITSINPITKAVIEYSKLKDWHVLVVGDLKSVPYKHENVTFLTSDDQEELQLESFKTTPYNHYSRKNIGYLYAMKNGAELIYDTDDDTIPYCSILRDFKCNTLVGGDTWVNPYGFYTDKVVWPRGFHLSEVLKPKNYTKEKTQSNIGVWQGIIDLDSDFDAVYRLTVNRNVRFKQRDDIAIDEMCFSPFNTQSTLWNRNLRELMYIPITVDFRFTDILRGYVAQRVMWNHGYKLGFHAPNTYQERNAHDFYKDFLGEISMYKHVPVVVDFLKKTDLKSSNLGENLLHCYEGLYSLGVVSSREIESVEYWLQDVNKK